MNTLSQLRSLIFGLILPTLAWSSANAQVYVEADPFAYALSGHSLHLGIQGNGFRFQVGTFGADVPDYFKDNEVFNVRQSGYGLKLDYYGARSDGGFVGIEYGKTTAEYELKGSGERLDREIDLLGVRFGYKWMIGNSFYVIPWVGIDKNISRSKDNLEFTLGGETYRETELFVFPTVHLGFDF